MALRDDQVLDSHHPALPWKVVMDDRKRDGNTTDVCVVVVMAEQVILRLKQHLYQLYWSQPVLVMETQVLLPTPSQPLSSPALAAPIEGSLEPAVAEWSASRVRLFLTGTKLWNSLYARWCRLIRLRRPRSTSLSSSSSSFFGFCDESTWWFPNQIHPYIN